MFQDTGSRLSIWLVSIDKISENMLFGSGAFYQNVNVGNAPIPGLIEPHNSVLQSLLNFGVIPTLLWFLIFFKFYISLCRNGRVFLIFWLVFGMFHPGFDAFLMTPFTIIVFLFAIFFGSPRQVYPQKFSLHSETGRPNF